MSEGLENVSVASVAAALEEESRGDSSTSEPDTTTPDDDSAPSDSPEITPQDDADGGGEEESDTDGGDSDGESEAENAGVEPDSEAKENRKFIAWAKETYGVDLGGKYQTDAAAVQGLLNAHHMVGQRDEDAQFGKYAKSLGLTPEQLVQLSQQQQATTPPSPDKPAIESPQEYKILQSRLYDAQGQVREDADPKDLVRIKEFRDQFQDYLVNSFFHREQQAADVHKSVAQLREELGQQAAAQQYVQKVQSFEQTNQSWLYADGQAPSPGQGKEFGPTGQAFMNAALAKKRRIDPATGRPYGESLSDLAILEDTLDLFQAQQAAQRKPTRKPKTAAGHRAEPADETPAAIKLPKPPDNMTDVDELSWLLQEEYKAQQRTAGVLQ